jgi:hypothetical protein
MAGDLKLIDKYLFILWVYLASCYYTVNLLSQSIRRLPYLSSDIKPIFVYGSALYFDVIIDVIKFLIERLNSEL